MHNHGQGRNPVLELCGQHRKFDIRKIRIQNQKIRANRIVKQLYQMLSRFRHMDTMTGRCQFPLQEGPDIPVPVRNENAISGLVHLLQPFLYHPVHGRAHRKTAGSMMVLHYKRAVGQARHLQFELNMVLRFSLWSTMYRSRAFSLSRFSMSSSRSRETP